MWETGGLPGQRECERHFLTTAWSTSTHGHAQCDQRDESIGPRESPRGSPSSGL
jgi:hypothetical protein